MLTFFGHGVVRQMSERSRTCFGVGVCEQIVVPSVAGAVILVSACFVLLSRCRVKVFAKFNLHPFDIDECESEDMAFDAFISCAWPDDALARAILDRLEGGSVEEGDRGGYRVCYHSRDFPLGGVILRSIQQSIERSKRVVCLLSEAFLSSEFCMLEFRTAWQWNLEHGRHRLIVVKCPGVDAALAVAERDAVACVEDVRMFLSTYTYIEHGSDDWWQKLLYAMPINRLPAVDADFHQQFFAGANYDNQENLLVPN